MNRRPTRPALEGGSEDDDEGEEKRKTRRAALSQLVNAAVALTVRPKPIHAVRDDAVGPATVITSTEGESTPIPFNFWAGPESDDDDDGSPSTVEFITEALDAGYSMEDLAKAEKALASGNVASAERHVLLLWSQTWFTGRRRPWSRGKAHCRRGGCHHQERWAMLFRRHSKRVVRGRARRTWLGHRR